MKSVLKYSTSLIMIGIGAAAGLTSMYLNVSHGLETSGVAGIICGLADAARISVPVIAADRGWSIQLKAGIIALGLFSLFNISNYIADQYGETIWSAMQGQETKATNAGKIAELKVKIDEFAEKRTSKTLRQLAEDERGNKYCGDRCKKLQSLADEAERREKLEAKVAELETKSDAVATVEVKGWALALVARGYSPIAAQTIIDALKGFGALIIVDMLVYFLIPGMAWLRKDRTDAQLANLGVQAQAPAPKVDAKGERKVSKEEAKRDLVTRLMALNGNAMFTSERQLAEVLGVSKSSLNAKNGWLKQWADAGIIEVKQMSPHQKAISLKKAA